MIRHDVRIEDAAICMTEHHGGRCDADYENDGDEIWTCGHPACPFHPRRVMTALNARGTA